MDANSKIKCFEYIPSKPNEGMILTRLGYQKTTTVFSDEYREKLNEIIKSGILLCNTKGLFGRYEIVQKGENFVKLENGVFLESVSLAKLLENSIEVVLMAATVGKDITDKIHPEVEGGDASVGLILDSVASQTADAALNWMVDFINKLIRREGKSLTRTRYSPGYGDLPLINQKKIFDALGLEKLGLEITERYMLIPEKSVIAIAGIEGIDSDE